jgi:tyrosyl-tRNA synthetase
VERVTLVLFGGEAIDMLTNDDLDTLAQEIPAVGGGSIVQVLIDGGAVKGTGEAKRLIAAGGVSVNGEKAAEDTEVKSPSLVKKGKNTFILVR